MLFWIIAAVCGSVLEACPGKQKRDRAKEPSPMETIIQQGLPPHPGPGKIKGNRSKEKLMQDAYERCRGCPCDEATVSRLSKLEDQQAEDPNPPIPMPCRRQEEMASNRSGSLEHRETTEGAARGAQCGGKEGSNVPRDGRTAAEYRPPERITAPGCVEGYTGGEVRQKVQDGAPESRRRMQGGSEAAPHGTYDQDGIKGGEGSHHIIKSQKQGGEVGEKMKENGEEEQEEYVSKEARINISKANKYYHTSHGFDEAVENSTPCDSCCPGEAEEGKCDCVQARFQTPRDLTEEHCCSKKGREAMQKRSQKVARVASAGWWC